MRLEHCCKAGFNYTFKTGNYNIETCPQNEWLISVMNRIDLANMEHNRVVVDISDLMKSDLVSLAHFTREEVIALVLYTGPMVKFFVCFVMHVFGADDSVGIFAVRGVQRDSQALSSRYHANLPIKPVPDHHPRPRERRAEGEPRDATLRRPAPLSRL